MTDKAREEFEAWLVKSNRSCASVHDETGRYLHYGTQSCWEAWKASRAVIVIELPVIVDKEWANTNAERSAMREAIAWCKKRIEAVGLNVKP